MKGRGVEVGGWRGRGEGREDVDDANRRRAEVRRGRSRDDPEQSVHFSALEKHCLL